MDFSIIVEASVLSEIEANNFSNPADARPYETGPGLEDSVVTTFTRGAGKFLLGQLDLNLGSDGPRGTDPVRDDGQELNVSLKRSTLEALRRAKRLSSGEADGQPLTALIFERAEGLAWQDALVKALDAKSWPVLPVADQ